MSLCDRLATLRVQQRLSVIRDADGRITRIRSVMPRHWITIWAAT